MNKYGLEFLVQVRAENPQALAQAQQEIEELRNLAQRMSGENEAWGKSSQQVNTAIEKQTLTVRQATQGLKFAAAMIVSEYNPALGASAVALDNVARITAQVPGLLGKLGIAAAGAALIVGGVYLQACQRAAEQQAELNLAVRRFDVEGMKSKISSLSGELELMARRSETAGGSLINAFRHFTDWLGITTSAAERIKDVRAALEQIAPTIQRGILSQLAGQIQGVRIEQLQTGLADLRDPVAIRQRYAQIQRTLREQFQERRIALVAEEEVAEARAKEISQAELDRVIDQYEKRLELLAAEETHQRTILQIAERKAVLEAELLTTAQRQAEAQAQAQMARGERRILDLATGRITTEGELYAHYRQIFARLREEYGKQYQAMIQERRQAMARAEEVGPEEKERVRMQFVWKEDLLNLENRQRILEAQREQAEQLLRIQQRGYEARIADRGINKSILDLVIQDYQIQAKQADSIEELQRRHEAVLTLLEQQNAEMLKQLEIQEALETRRAAIQAPGTEGEVQERFARQRYLLEQEHRSRIIRTRSEQEDERLMLARLQAELLLAQGGGGIAVTEGGRARLQLAEIERQLAAVRGLGGGTVQERYQAAIQAAKLEQERTQLLQEQQLRTDPLAGLRAGMAESLERLEHWGESAREIARDTATTMASSFAQLFFAPFEGGTKRLQDVMKQFGLSIVRSITEAMGQAATASILRTVFPGGGLPFGSGPLGAGLGGAVQTLGAGAPVSIWQQGRNWQPGGSWQPGMTGSDTLGGTAGMLSGLSQYLGPSLAVGGGLLGLYGAIRSASPLGIATGALSGLTAGLGASALLGASGWTLGPLGAGLGAVAGLISYLAGGAARSRARNRRITIGQYDHVWAALQEAVPGWDIEQIDEALGWVERGEIPSDPAVWAALDRGDGSLLDLRPWGDVDRATGGDAARIAVRDFLRDARANARPLGGVLIEEALAPGITRFEALAGTGPRQRQQALRAIRRGALVELINAAGPEELETMLTRIREVAELRGLPILPQARYVEVLG